MYAGANHPLPQYLSFFKYSYPYVHRYGSPQSVWPRITTPHDVAIGVAPHPPWVTRSGKPFPVSPEASKPVPDGAGPDPYAPSLGSARSRPRGDVALENPLKLLVFNMQDRAGSQ